MVPFALSGCEGRNRLRKIYHGARSFLPMWLPRRTCSEKSPCRRKVVFANVPRRGGGDKIGAREKRLRSLHEQWLWRRAQRQRERDLSSVGKGAAPEPGDASRVRRRLNFEIRKNALLAMSVKVNADLSLTEGAAGLFMRCR